MTDTRSLGAQVLEPQRGHDRDHRRARRLVAADLEPDGLGRTRLAWWTIAVAATAPAARRRARTSSAGCPAGWAAAAGPGCSSGRSCAVHQHPSQRLHNRGARRSVRSFEAAGLPGGRATVRRSGRGRRARTPGCCWRWPKARARRARPGRRRRAVAEHGAGPAWPARVPRSAGTRRAADRPRRARTSLIAFVQVQVVQRQLADGRGRPRPRARGDRGARHVRAGGPARAGHGP